jgi:hypothetical protein
MSLTNNLSNPCEENTSELKTDTKQDDDTTSFAKSEFIHKRLECIAKQAFVPVNIRCGRWIEGKKDKYDTLEEVTIEWIFAHDEPTERKFIHNHGTMTVHAFESYLFLMAQSYSLSIDTPFQCTLEWKNVTPDKKLKENIRIFIDCLTGMYPKFRDMQIGLEPLENYEENGDEGDEGEEEGDEKEGYGDEEDGEDEGDDEETQDYIPDGVSLKEYRKKEKVSKGTKPVKGELEKAKL